MAKRKGKGKVSKVISDEKRQAIVVAAANAQKKIRKANMVFAVIFVAAIGWLTVRSAYALLAGADLTPVAEPEPFSMKPSPATRPETIAPSLDQTLALSDRDAMREAGLDVRRADELDRDEQTQRPVAPQRDATAEQRKAFADTMQSADRAMNQQHDYATAVKRYEAAKAVPNIPTLEREQASLGLDRARVYLTITRDIVPLKSFGQFVEYTTPTNKVIVGVVPRAQRWESGQVTVTRLDDSAVLYLTITGEWGAKQINDPAAVAELLAGRLQAQLVRLQARKKSGLVSPLDLCEAAVAILETGDVTTGGRELAVRPLAHGCLGEAWDMCEAAGCSLADTVLMRRDPTNMMFIGSLTLISKIERELADPETPENEKPILRDTARQHLEVAERTLRDLVRRFPGSWDFRDHRGDGLIADIRKRYEEDRQRQSRPDADPIDDGVVPPIEPPADDLPSSEKARYLLTKGEATLEEGYAIVRKTRDGAYNYSNLRGDLLQAIERFRAAHEYLRLAREEAPGNRRIDNLMTECRRAIHDAQKMMPLGRSDRGR